MLSMVENKEWSYSKYWDVNNLYEWAMSEEVPVNGFRCVEETSLFNESFIENYNEESNEGYFLDGDGYYSEKLHELPNDLPFLPERMKIHKAENFVSNLHDKKNMLFT